MENCLKTQLKGVVNNDNLEIYGGIKVTMGAVGTHPNGISPYSSDKIIGNKPFDIYDHTGIKLASNVTEYVNQYKSQCDIRCSQPDTVINILNKYYTFAGLSYLENVFSTRFGNIEIDLSTLNYVQSLTDKNIYISYPKGSSNNVTFKGTFNFATTNNWTTVQLNGIANNSSAWKITVPNDGQNHFGANFRVFDINYSTLYKGYDNIELDLASFNKCTNLTKIFINGSHLVTGNVNSLLDSLYANGKVSGTVEIVLADTNCTYNGETGIISKNFTFSDSGWTPANS